MIVALVGYLTVLLVFRLAYLSMCRDRRRSEYHDH